MREEDGYAEMKIGTLIEELICIKKKYDIYYPDDNYINLACNILEKIPQQLEVNELIEKVGGLKID